ncbi:TPA: AAA family ATPase [Cronobacter sakazakii]|nr:AAA family ATPase [Cronobacter sakazakii]EJV9474175.1 AAA family ATPase [Cronobacter sakazakii]ELY2773100.1 AAA family ATPase [Cronobacter sakazakii]ELY6360334.1 AAA family ATPase [Cronobacter sakazakii]HDK7323747.1 AAA family ATPase [Cronobacter sakazakii]
MTSVISLFNHKGGVSKTTTVFHLGWKIANLGKRVLIVDADPQCNLTGLTLGLDDYDSLVRFYDNKQNTDIFNSLAPEFSLEGVMHSPLTATPITPTKNDNLFILAGNIRFAELDTQIATAMTSSNTLPVLRKFVGAFNNLIRKMAAENNIDIVLVDMSPSVSSTNQCILMSSDYFLVPVSPDFYCYQAIDSLSSVLPKWAEEIKPFKKGGGSPLPTSNPKMLGFITQNYRIYTTTNQTGNEDCDQPKQMSRAYSDWLDRIKEVSNRRLVPALEASSMMIKKEHFIESVTHDSPYHLGGVQNFSGLIPVSQKLSKPIFELSKEDGNWSGARWMWEKNGKENGIKVNIEEADRVYMGLAHSVLNMIALDKM